MAGAAVRDRIVRVVVGGALALTALGAAPGAAAAAQPADPVTADGEDRVARALAWSALLPAGGAPEALIATTADFADALASGTAQAALDAPLLLTGPEALDDRVRAELVRLGTRRVTILGGTAAVSPAVEASLRDAVEEVVRIGGATRIETARLLADAHAPEAVRVLVVRAFGEGSAAFADALGAGAAAVALDRPVVLVGEELDDATAAWLQARGANSALVAGGPAAVPDAVLDQLQAIGTAPARLAGPTRTATAAALRLNCDVDGPCRTGEEAVALVEGEADDAWVEGFAAALHAPGGILLARGGSSELPGATGSSLFFNQPTEGLRCGTTVPEGACDTAARITAAEWASAGQVIADDEQLRGPGAGDASAGFGLGVDAAAGILCTQVESSGLPGGPDRVVLDIPGGADAVEVPVEEPDLLATGQAGGCATADPDALAAVLADPPATTATVLDTAGTPMVRGQVIPPDARTARTTLHSDGPTGPSQQGAVWVLETGTPDRVCTVIVLNPGADGAVTTTAALRGPTIDGELPLTAGPHGVVWHCDTVDPATATGLFDDPAAYEVVFRGPEVAGGEQVQPLF